MESNGVVIPNRVGVWSTQLRARPFGEVREVASEIEQLGYGSIWFPESPLGEPFVMSALTLASTERVFVGTGVANIWFRHAVTMESTARALGQTFPRRFLLGLGISHSRMMDPLFPNEYKSPLAKMRAYLDAMDAPPPSGGPARDRSPRVLGALADGMLALARDRADGAHPYNVTPEHTRHAREVLGPGKLLVPEQAVALCTDRDAVLTRAREYLSGYFPLVNYRRNWERQGFTEDDFADGGSERLCDAVVAAGDADAIRRRVQEHLDAGADHVVVQVLPEDRRVMPLAEWRELAPALSPV